MQTKEYKMKKMDKQELVEELLQKTRSIKLDATTYLKLNLDDLRWRQGANEWNVLECLEHLNRYGAFYLPEIKRKIEAFSGTNPSDQFKPGILGNYFVSLIQPKETLNKMTTTKSMNPLNSSLDQSTIRQFIDQQQLLLTLLEKARTVDLNRIRTSVSISRFIKIRLGDTLRFVVEHNLRHITQANHLLRKLRD